ncbi:ricin B lectin domain-containing protein [Mycena galopus ATCC 62051]|nr:ricin B lectin domain-containing protein [Mycena galopus ATCC 62051]
MTSVSRILSRANAVDTVDVDFVLSDDVRVCFTVANNTEDTPLTIQNCNTAGSLPNQACNLSFTENAGPQPIKIFGDKCIDVKDGLDADGTRLQIATCVEGNKNQEWIFVQSTLQWSGTNKCVDIPDGNMTDGNALQIYTCDDNSSMQRWAAEPSQ